MFSTGVLLVDMPIVVYDQVRKVEDLEKELGLPFVSNIIECVKQRVEELTQGSLNEYLWHIYHGIEARTGIHLWLIDNDVCRNNFKPQIPGEPCILWVLDILRSLGVKQYIVFPLSEEHSQLLLRVYDSECID